MYFYRVSLLSGDACPQERAYGAKADAIHKRYRIVTLRDVAVLYGQRSTYGSVWYMSPYDFVAEWEVEMLSYPQNTQDMNNATQHVRVMDDGRNL